MNTSVSLLLLLLLGGAGLICMFTVIRLLVQRPVERTMRILESSLGRCLLLGLVNFLFAGLLIALLLLPARLGGVVAGICVFLAGAVTLLVLALSMLGLSAAASLLGARADETRSAVPSQVRGGLLLVLASLTPYVGWFIFAPLAIWAGLVGAIQTLAGRRPEAIKP